MSNLARGPEAQVPELHAIKAKVPCFLSEYSVIDVMDGVGEFKTEPAAGLRLGKGIKVC